MHNQIKYIIISLLSLTLISCGTTKIDTAVKNGAKKLSAHEIRELLTGSTVKSSGYGEEAEIKYLPKGKLTARNIDNDKDIGMWQVDDLGRLCLKFRKWGQGDKICYLVYEDGQKYKQFTKNGLLAYSFTIIEKGGNFEEEITYDGNIEKTTPQTNSPVIKNTAVRSSIPTPPPSPEDLKFIIRQTARNCPGCNLAKAQLSGSNLLNANLAGANLAGANLSYTTLRHANLRGANLYNANLQGANLSGADLTGANLTGANLDGANLTGAVGY